MEKRNVVGDQCGGWTILMQLPMDDVCDVVLACDPHRVGGEEWVSWLYNFKEGGFHLGHYSRDKKAAHAEFAMRAKLIGDQDEILEVLRGLVTRSIAAADRLKEAHQHVWDPDADDHPADGCDFCVAEELLRDAITESLKVLAGV